MRSPRKPSAAPRSSELAARREAILAAWRDSPTRFREDSNAEEDLLHGGYADRLLVELCANAADAGATTVRVRLVGDVLSVANDGAPLTEAGIDALTSLRASSKRDGSATGRFGVGFSAVLAVTDAPELRSTSGGVRFSAELTAAAVSDVEHLRDEHRRRAAVPVLRLPWEPGGPPADGWTTEVLLPLRDARAVDSVRATMREFDPTLLLALPLSRVDMAGRIIERSTVMGQWRLARREGATDPVLLADRPIEERTRTRWWVVAAMPPHSTLPVNQVVHAPTPSGELLALPVHLIGTFPLDATRRHVHAGPLAEYLIDQAAEAIVDLVRDMPDIPDGLLSALWESFPASPFDAMLRARLTAALAERPWLPGARTPRDAITVPDPLVAPLSEVLDGVLPTRWHSIRALGRLGVRALTTAEIVDAVAGVRRAPSWWRSLYAGLSEAGADPGELGALPVPLVGGRTVTGPRGVLLPDPDMPASVAALGLRVAHPDATHPLLERLGARPASPRAVLADDAVRVAVRDSFDNADHAPLAAAVLDLVAAAGLRPGDEPWLAELALPAEDGEWYPAGELLLRGGRLAAVVAHDSPFGVCAAGQDADGADPGGGSAPLSQVGRAALLAAGVLDTFAVLDVPDLIVADIDELHLDGAAEWAAQFGDDALIERFTALRDLEWVDDWAAARPLLLEHRDVLTAPCRVVLADGTSTVVSSYTRWWLARQPVLDGRRPRETTTARELLGVYDPAPAGGALLGAWPSLAAILADRDAVVDLLERLGDPRRVIAPELLADVYSGIAAADLGLEPPRMVRVAPELVVSASDVVVVDQPWLLHLLGGKHPVMGGLAVAELLDVPLLSEL